MAESCPIIDDPLSNATDLLSQDKELSGPSTLILILRKSAVNASFFGTRPVKEGNILCYSRQDDAIRWIVYEICQRKVCVSHHYSDTGN
jgi:hypothetical protein